MSKAGKRKTNPRNTIKVIVKNRPTNKEAGVKLKKLGEMLSRFRQDKDCF